MIIDDGLHNYIQSKLDDPKSNNFISENEPEVIILKKAVASIKEKLNITVDEI